MTKALASPAPASVTHPIPTMPIPARTRRHWRGWDLTILVAVLLPSGLFATDAATVANLTAKSGYIFQGTIQKLRAATPTVPVEASTAIVQVSKVIDGSKDIGNFQGKEVTVRLLAPEKVRAGSSLVFFTRAYFFGKTVGLAEVGMLPDDELETLSRQIADARQASADAALSKQLETAALVVVATAGEPKPTEEIKRPDKDEHDPLWWVVPLKVERVEKGASRGESVSVFFAYNTDYKWFRSPKIHAGQRAIFLLHPEAREAYGLKGFFVVDKFDVVSLEDLQQVQRLLKTNR